jgi:hypothetical protein
MLVQRHEVDAHLVDLGVDLINIIAHIHTSCCSKNP